MTVWRLVRKEILHRRLNFALAVLSVAVAAGVLVAHVILLRVHDARTERLMDLKRDEAEKRLAEMQDDYRKYMKELGFNLLILPKDQELAEFWESGYATHTMAEENVDILAETGTQSMRHLLPIVQQKVLWPEQKRRIILIGTRGEVVVKGRGQKEPMLVAVPEGKAHIGYELAENLGLKPGDPMKLLGRDFQVERVRPRKGSAEDTTIWIHLAAAQQLLGMPGRINAIEALKCYCVGAGSEQLQEEIARALPGVKVVLRENKVTVRAKARERAKTEATSALAELAATRRQMREARQEIAEMLVPLVILGAAVWTGLLALGNVRQRRGEIGILRAIGVRSSRIVAVFLARAVLIGLAGAALGYGLGLAVGLVAVTWSEEPLAIELSANLFVPVVLVAMILAAPMLSAAASWVPALVAGRQDPAVVLQQE